MTITLRVYYYKSGFENLMTLLWEPLGDEGHPHDLVSRQEQDLPSLQDYGREQADLALRSVGETRTKTPGLLSANVVFSPTFPTQISY